MKYAYIVKGSEDGNIGVFTSKKKAVEAAVNYVAAGNEMPRENVEIDDRGYLVFVGHGWASADVEKFPIN